MSSRGNQQNEGSECKLVSKYVVAARVRSTTGGYVFTGVGEGGGGFWYHVLSEGGCTPLLPLSRGYPLFLSLVLCKILTQVLLGGGGGRTAGIWSFRPLENLLGCIYLMEKHIIESMQICGFSSGEEFSINSMEVWQLSPLDMPDKIVTDNSVNSENNSHFFEFISVCNWWIRNKTWSWGFVTARVRRMGGRDCFQFVCQFTPRLGWGTPSQVRMGRGYPHLRSGQG